MLRGKAVETGDFASDPTAPGGAQSKAFRRFGKRRKPIASPEFRHHPGVDPGAYGFRIAPPHHRISRRVQRREMRAVERELAQDAPRLALDLMVGRPAHAA